MLGNILGVILNLPPIAVLSGLAHAYSLSILPLGAALLLGVFPNPALAGLQTSLASDEAGGIREQWAAIRANWLPVFRTWAVATAVSLVLIFNVVFYAHRSGPVSGIAALLWACALLIWVVVHLYVFPLLLRQERPRMRDAYRNAAVITLARPIYTVAVGVVWLAWLLLTATTGVAYVIGFAMAAAIQEQALAAVLPTFTRSTSSD